MKYLVVSADQLMEHEYEKVEGSLSHIRHSDLTPILPKGTSPAKFLEDVAQGNTLLITDIPTTPLLTYSKQAAGTGEWTINPEAKDTFDSRLITQLEQRISNVTKHSSSTQSKTDSLTPAPKQYYQPEPAKTESHSEDSKEPISYEYNIEIAFSKKAPNHPINLNTLLVNKDDQTTESSWEGKPTQYGTKYRITSPSNAPRRLSFRVANNTMGLSLPSVSMLTLGADTAKEAFVPIMPVRQFGERLGIITTGYLYHFQGERLVQEYKWKSEQGFSPLSASNAEHAFNLVGKALLVYWKIDGEVIEDQYLVYRTERLSQSERAAPTSEWLEAEGIPLDIEAILAVTQADILKRDSIEEADREQKVEAVKHTIQISDATGQRESLIEIAEQYGTTPAELIKHNPSYRTNLAALKVGTTLLITPAQQPKPTTTDGPYELPPEAPSAYNNPFNSHYQWVEKRILFNNGMSLLPLKPPSVKQGLPLVNVKPERILRIGLFFDGTG